MNGIRIALTDPTIRAVTPSSLETRRLRPDSLVLEKSGGGEKQNVGRVALVGGLDRDAICSNFMAVMDVDAATSSSFLNYAFSALYDTDMNFPSVKQTTGIQNLDVVAYLSTQIAFPARDEQKRIAAFLDASCLAIDAAVKAKQEQINVLSTACDSVVHQEVTAGVGGKTGWVEDRIRDRLVRIVGGDWGDEPGTEALIDVTVVRVADINGIRIHLEDPTIRAVSCTSLSSRRLNPTSLVIEKSGGGEKQNVGRVALVGEHEGDAICSNFMAVLDCDEKTDSTFLNYVFSALYKSDQNYPCVKQTTGIQNLDVTAYLTTHVWFPSLAEQKRIVENLNAELEQFDEIQALIEQQIATLIAYRKSLIHECVTGQRRITDEDVNRVTAHAASLA